MKLQLYPSLGEVVLVRCASDGDRHGGVLQDTVEYVTGLHLLFENHSLEAHTVSIGKSIRTGPDDTPKTFDWYWYTIPSASVDTYNFRRPITNPHKLLVGPFDMHVPTEDLSDRGVSESDVQISYPSGTDGLYVAAIGRKTDAE